MRAEAVGRFAARLERAYADGVEVRHSRLLALWRHAGAVSYRGVLARGFALVRDEADRALRRAADVSEGQRLTIEFADGAVPAVAGRGSTPEPRASRPPRRRRGQSAPPAARAAKGRARCSERRPARRALLRLRADRRERRPRALHVLGVMAAADADRADHLAPDHDRETRRRTRSAAACG